MGFKLDSDTFFSKKVLIPLGIIAAIGVIIIIVSVFSNQKSPMEDVFKLNTRVTNLSKTITTYKGSLKSSDLTASTSTFTALLASLTSTLKPTTSSEEYKALEKSKTKEITTSETELINNINTSLNNAKLNASLDEAYASAMATQIIELIKLEQTIKNSTKDDSLKSALSASESNLNSLYPEFSNFKP